MPKRKLKPERTKEELTAVYDIVFNIAMDLQDHELAGGEINEGDYNAILNLAKDIMGECDNMKEHMDRMPFNPSVDKSVDTTKE